MEEGPVYLDLPASLRKRLDQVDLRKELRKQGIDARIQYGKIPGAPWAKASRDVSLIILASGVAATLIGTAVAKIIDAWSRRPNAHTKVTSRPVPQENSSTEFRLGGTILSFKTASGDAARPPTEKGGEAKDKPAAAKQTKVKPKAKTARK
jgi:hypothetical protein